MKLTCDRTATQHYGDDNGKRYWGITQTLHAMIPDLYAGVPLETLEAAAHKGRAVHFYFAFLMGSRVGVKAAPAVLQRYEGYCRAILRWVDDNKPEPILVEETGAWPGKPVAGTPDMLCLYGLKRVPTIIELKTTAQRHTIHRTQVTIQRRLEGYQVARQLRLLYVDNEGNYDDVPVHPDPHGEAAFLNAIQLLNWRLRA